MRNRVCGKCGQREPLQIIALGRLTVLHLALPMLRDEEEIEVDRSISPFMMYHMHKMHILFGKLDPRPSRIRAIADILGVSMDYLAGRKAEDVEQLATAVA